MQTLAVAGQGAGVMRSNFLSSPAARRWSNRIRTSDRVWWTAVIAAITAIVVFTAMNSNDVVAIPESLPSNDLLFE